LLSYSHTFVADCHDIDKDKFLFLRQVMWWGVN